MKNSVATGQVSGQVEAQEAQVTLLVAQPVTPPVGGQPEWFSKGGQAFLSANKKLMANWKTRPPVIEAEARKSDKALKGIMEKSRL